MSIRIPRAVPVFSESPELLYLLDFFAIPDAKPRTLLLELL